MERWSSKTGFILAAIGSAVGIGNIWRFSSVVGQNGGGAYLVPYLVACTCCALPLMILETAAGRAFRGDVVTVFSSALRNGNRAGWLLCAIVFVILSYYLVITGWTLAFALFSAAGVPENYTAFTGSYEPVLFFFASAVIVGIIVSLGIRAGIERISSVLIPLVFFILGALALYAATLPGFSEGIRYFLSPDFSVLGNPTVWTAALGQAFFSLSVGEGILITYGAYLGKEAGLVRSAAIIMVFDIAASLLAGMVIFPIVFTSGLSPAAGAELAFITLPKAFAVMPFGRLIGPAFFLLLFVAALTSALAILEVDVAALTGATRLGRRKACMILTALVILVGLPSALSYSGPGLNIAGQPVLDIVDESFGTLGLIFSALITSLVLSWHAGRDVIRRELGGSGTTGTVVLAICRWIIPLFLAGTLLYRIVSGTGITGWVTGFSPTGPLYGPLLAFSLILFGGLFLAILVSCRLRGGWCPWKKLLR